MSERSARWQVWLCLGRRRVEVGRGHFAWLRTDYFVVGGGIERL